MSATLRHEIVIVGGGAAGLAARQRLRESGQDGVLLEARNRLGGRIWTEHPPGWPLAVELGAEFIHGRPPELKGLGMAADPRQTEAWTTVGGGLRRAGEFAGGADRVFERMHERPRAAPDVSFATFLAERCSDLPEAARNGALAYIEGYEAADAARISVRSLIREQEAEEDGGGWPRRPRSGYGTMVEELAGDGATGIRLGAAVERIAWRPGSVVIEARGARVEARCAILTLPLALLQAGAVQFDPPLEAKRAAIGGLVTGGALRITLRLRVPIWRELRDSEGAAMDALGFLFGHAEASGHFPTWWASEGGGAAQITGWAAGRHAWALAGWPMERLRERGLNDLAERLGIEPERLRNNLVEGHSHDWQTDPHACGAYSYAAVGGAGAFAALAEPLAGTLFFAGEATDSSGHHATVQGGLRSGRRAAEEALAAVVKLSLSPRLP